MCGHDMYQFVQVFKVRSKEDGQLYAVKRSRQRFRGDLDRCVWSMVCWGHVVWCVVCR